MKKIGWRALVAWAAIGIGAVALVIGYVGVSAQTVVAKQLPYLISGGLTGVVAIGAGVALLVAEDLRSDRERLGRLEAQILEIRDALRGDDAGRARNTG
jgi:hypothetical protein